MPGIQDEFIKTMTESWAGLAKTWADISREARAGSASDQRRPAQSPWMNPSMFLDVIDSASGPVRFQEMVKIAAEDLPDLLRYTADDGKVERIKKRWARNYEKLLSEMLGIPSRSGAEQFLDQWRSFWAPLSGMLPVEGRGPFHNLSAFASPAAWPFAMFPSAVPDLLRVWGDMPQKTGVASAGIPGMDFAREFQEIAKSSLDAYVEFLHAVPGLHGQVLAFAERIVDKVIGYVRCLEIKEITSETQRLFYGTWLAESEDASEELFGSDVFRRALAETVQQGLEAERKMESAMNYGFPFRNALGRKGINEAGETVRSLEERIRRIEEELESLKDRLAAATRLSTTEE